jgi:hypothetical protein
MVRRRALFAPSSGALATPQRLTRLALAPPRVAIRFVLSDLFSTMRAEDRQSLLHVRALHAAPAAPRPAGARANSSALHSGFLPPVARSAL